MTLTILSKHSRTIKKIGEGTDATRDRGIRVRPFGAQDEYERRVIDLEQESIRNSEI